MVHRMHRLPVNYAVEERPTLTAVRALNDGWHNQLCKHDPHQREAHENQQQANVVRRHKVVIVTVSGLVPFDEGQHIFWIPAIFSIQHLSWRDTPALAPYAWERMSLAHLLPASVGNSDDAKPQQQRCLKPLSRSGQRERLFSFTPERRVAALWPPLRESCPDLHHKGRNQFFGRIQRLLHYRGHAQIPKSAPRE